MIDEEAINHICFGTGQRVRQRKVKVGAMVGLLAVSKNFALVTDYKYRDEERFKTIFFYRFVSLQDSRSKLVSPGRNKASGGIQRLCSKLIGKLAAGRHSKNYKMSIRQFSTCKGFGEIYLYPHQLAAIKTF